MEVDVDGGRASVAPLERAGKRRCSGRSHVTLRREGSGHRRSARRMVMCGALATALLGCEAPKVGDPCEPGDPLVTFMPGSEEELSRVCRLSAGGGTCSLGCTGPAGCDGDASFEREWAVLNYHWTWCGCDGRTHQATEDDDGNAGGPSTRWRWWGTCEDPCVGVSLGSAGWGWLPEAFFGAGGGDTPVAPQCTRCIGAVVAGEECVGADGAPVSLDCCTQCANATATSTGCVDSVAGTALSPHCCE